MCIPASALTVYFEDPFWVGVFQREEDGKLSFCKVTFGTEPRDQEVYGLILRAYDSLEFGPCVMAGPRRAEGSPKRLHRQARRATRPSGVGTKAQQALQLQREQGKQARRTARKERDEAEQARRYALKQRKKKEKHKGR